MVVLQFEDPDGKYLSRRMFAVVQICHGCFVIGFINPSPFQKSRYSHRRPVVLSISTGGRNSRVHR